MKNCSIMSGYGLYLAVSALILWCAPAHAQYGDLILKDPQVVQKVVAKYQSGNINSAATIKNLVGNADARLQEGPFSVTLKTQLPPSGDIHDYMSMGPYWWPDPEKEDGLPYIRKDGEINPEYFDYKDKEQLGKLMNALTDLSHGFVLTGEEKYAAHAIGLLQAWFLDPETKMNPNLNFAQRIPGVTEGRGIGIIDTRRFADLPDIIHFLERSAHWSPEIGDNMKGWIGEYLDWLVNSQHGKDEAIHGNNHTTWYFAQTVPLALYLGRDAQADSLAQAGLPLILDVMIEGDGSQPKELARTKSWDYSSMNLFGMYQFALACEHLGMDLWNYTNGNGGGLKAALDYLVSYADGENKWGFEQITPMDPAKIIPCLHIAAVKFGEQDYEAIAEKLSGSEKDFSFMDWAGNK